MKKITIIFAILFLIAFTIPVDAALTGISGGNANLIIDGTPNSTTISINLGKTYDVVQGTVSASGSVGVNTSTIAGEGSQQISVSAKSVGKGTVTVSGFVVDADDMNNNRVSFTKTFTYNVTKKEVPPTNPTTPTTPTTPPTTPTTPTKPTTPSTPNKTPEQISKEKEEAEKAEKEKAAKTPLIGEVKLFSDSVKMYNELLNTVVPEFDKWDYSFTLPKRIEKIFLSVTPIDSNTVVTFDEKLDFNELDSKEHTFEIRAKLGDVEQVIKYTVSMDTSEASKIEHDGAEFVSFDDEILDKFLVESAKFSKLTFKNSQNADVPYYQMGALNVIPVIDSNNKAKWFILDDNFAVTKSVIILFDSSNRPFFIFDAPEDSKIKTIQGVSYQDASVEIPETLNSIDDTITWDNTIKSWKLESGSILYGMDDTGKEGNFYLDEQGNISFAVVTYDSKGAVDYKTWAYAASATSVVLLISFASYVFVNLKQKKSKI